MKAVLYDRNGKFLRCTELPAAPGRAVAAPSSVFDGTTVYVHVGDVAHALLYRETLTHGSGPRVKLKEGNDVEGRDP